MRDLAPATISQIQRSTNFNHNDVLNVIILDEAVVVDAITLLGLFPNLTSISVNGVVQDVLVVTNDYTAIPTPPMPANSLLIFTGNVDAGDIAALFTALRTAQPANIILTEQTGTVPNGGDEVSWAGENSWLKSFYAEQMTGVGDYAFERCYSLTDVSLPSASSIGAAAFFYCSSLTSVSLPSASIGNRAFINCTSLTNVSLPSATSIGMNAFSYCSALTSVSLPLVTSIGNYAFAYCTALTSVSFGAAITSFGTTGVFAGGTASYITLHLLNAIEFGKASGNDWNGYTFLSIVNTP
jgi:hypothetical protein